MIRTPLCDLLGIQLPILNAPMGGGYANSALAAAVSGAGGLGMIGGTTGGGVDWLRGEVRTVRDHTDRPFGIGFISHLDSTMALMEAALADGVRLIAHSFTDPGPFIGPAHAAGALVLCQVQTVDQARAAVAAGADVIIAQGTEAGGHTGMASTLPLVPAVVDAVHPVPVIAAGGIADGRGIAAALMLGAQGAWLGTRFITTPESGYPEAKKARVVAAGTSDTVFTLAHDIADRLPWPADIRGRTIRNAFSDRWHGREDELARWIGTHREEHATNQQANDPDETSLYAGQAAGLITSLEPAADIVRRLTAEAEEAIRASLRLIRDNEATAR